MKYSCLAVEEGRLEVQDHSWLHNELEWAGGLSTNKTKHKHEDSAVILRLRYSFP